jgi:EmrB/QacA subfamily drug resistance transporter
MRGCIIETVMDSVSPKGPENQKRTAVLITVLATSFLTSFSGSALNLAIPEISREFPTSASLLGWIVTAYILCSATLAVPFGRISDVGGRRPVYLMGILIFALTSGATFFAWNFWVVLVLRILQGIGGAMIFATNIAILVNAYPPQMRGKVLGYSVASTYVGLSMGPVAGGLLTHNFGWRSVFAVNLVAGLLAFFIALLRLPREQKKTGAKSYDAPGMLLYSFSVFGIMYGLTTVSDGWLGTAILVAGLALFFVFLRHELRTEMPALEVRLFKNNPNFLLSNLAALLNYGATYATGYLVSIFLQVVQGHDPQQSGLIMICQPAMMAVVSLFAGRLSDRHSPYRLASIGMAFCTVSLFSYIFVGVEASLGHIILNLVLVGIGFGFFASPNTNAIMSNVKPQDYSVASSLISTMRTIGQVGSMAIITAVTQMRLGSQTFEEAPAIDLVGAMRFAFIIFSIICAAGIFISLQRHSAKD